MSLPALRSSRWLPLLVLPCSLALLMCGSDDEGDPTTAPVVDGGAGADGGGSSSGEPGPRDGSPGGDGATNPKTATFAFARTFPGNVQGNAEYGEPPVAALPGGGYVIAFLFTGTITMGTSTLVSTGARRDLALVWVDGSGAPVRGKLVDANDDIDPLGLAVDGQGNVYLAATSFSASVALGDGQTGAGNGTSQYGLVVKYDANGVAQWGRSFQSNGGLGSFTVMARGTTVAVAGYSTLNGGIVYATAGGNVASPTFVGNNHKGFVASLDPATGNVVWFEQLAGPLGGKVWEGAVTSTGDVVLAGEFEGGDLSTDDPVVLGARTGQRRNAFVTKLSGTGTHVWTRTWGSTALADTVGTAVAIGASDRVIAAGVMAGPVDFGKGARTGASFVVSLEGATGTTTWDKAMPSGIPASVVASASGGVVTSSDNSAAVPAASVDGIALPTRAGGHLVAFDATGNVVWAKAAAITAPSRTSAGQLAAQGVVVVEHGTMTGTADFGGGAIVSNGDAGSAPATFLHGFTP